MNSMELRSALSPESFFVGFLAAVALQKRVIQGTRSELHQAFYEAVSNAEKARFINTEDLDIDFDPLYEVSPWFDRALTRAQRDLMISFPNPSYERIQIAFEPQEATEILDEIARGAYKEGFQTLARDFLNHLHS